MNKWVRTMVAQRRAVEAKVVPPWEPSEDPAAGKKRRRGLTDDDD
jgi:hypothetical protein